MSGPIALADLRAQRRRLGAALDEAMARVVEHGTFIMGPEVGELEDRLAGYCGVRHAVTCASGTDALVLCLLAHGVGRGDAVVVPAFTFAATAEAVALLGAEPVFADVDAVTATLDPHSVRRAIDVARAGGLRPRGIVAVDLYGQPADYDALHVVARSAGVWILADAAQSFGAASRGRRAGSLAHATATSFFPTKPLGCYGDGGAVLTDDDDFADLLRSLRSHGMGRHKYEHLRVGLNGRLDTLQAAVLMCKLRIFDEELAARRRIAGQYTSLLGDLVSTPRLAPDVVSAWAQYTIRLDDRDTVAARLAEAGVPTAVHYPEPLHRQPAFRSCRGDSLPVAAALARRVLCLPMHPYLTDSDLPRIVEQLGMAIHAGRVPEALS